MKQTITQQREQLTLARQQSVDLQRSRDSLVKGLFAQRDWGFREHTKRNRLIYHALISPSHADMSEKVAAQARVASEALTVVKQQEQLVSCVQFS